VAELKLLGGLHWHTKEKKQNIMIEPGKKVKEYLAELNVPVKEVQIISVNEAQKPLDYVVQPDDTVTILPVVSDG